MTENVVIIGGGVIGLSIAYALSREGIRPIVLERRRPGAEASWAGAGLIPPISEGSVKGNHGRIRSPISALRAWSSSLYADWSQALREETGIDNGYHRCGGVDVAITEAEADALSSNAGQWRAEGIVFERLSEADRTRVEPGLGPGVRLAYFLPDRAQIRNPRHLRALAEAATARGARILPWHEVQTMIERGGKIDRVVTSVGEFACDWLVLAAGAWSGRLLQGAGVKAPTPPVKGQIVLLRHKRPLLRRIIEHGKDYLVPRLDGRILIGATEEDAGFDSRPTQRSFESLIEAAVRLCPVLAEAEVEATWAGLRPGSIDGKPYLGLATGFTNLIVATGHQRAGLQLSPATAELVVDLVLGRSPRLDLSAFRSDRAPDIESDAFRS